MIAAGGVLRFQPNDEELVEHHLKPKILDPDSDRHYIGEVKNLDLSQFEPSELFRMTQKNPDDKEGYFFWSPPYKNGRNRRIVRKGKNGFWNETGRGVLIDCEGEQSVAKKRMFVFCQGVHPGTRTAWSIYQLELLTHLDNKKIFLCKLFERKVKQKDKVSGNKRKVKQNVQEMSTKPKRGRTDNSWREKAKVSSAKEAQLNDEHNSHIMSLSLPSDPDSSILIGELTPQSHHLPSKHFSEDASNILTGSVYHFPFNIRITEYDQSVYRETYSSLELQWGHQSELPALEAYGPDQHANHNDFNSDEMLKTLEQQQPPTLPKVQSCNVLPPSSDGLQLYLDTLILDELELSALFQHQHILS